jgi:carbon monoxide dehydrogenase subunit G
MFKTVVIVVVAACAALLFYAGTRADTFRVERSARIEAPPERIFGLIDDLQRFNTWNPYEKKDPTAKGHYGTTTGGPGAWYSWDGEKIGAGRMEIVDTAVPSQVTMKLDFYKPFEAHNMVEFTMRPDGDATRVTWSMHGPAPFVTKLMQVFSIMDRMVGKDFEDGLNNLKTLAEAH